MRLFRYNIRAGALGRPLENCNFDPEIKVSFQADGPFVPRRTFSLVQAARYAFPAFRPKSLPSHGN